MEIIEKSDKPIFNNFFQIDVHTTWKKMIYKYDNNQLIFYKNINEFYNSQKEIYNCLQINENEYAFYTLEKGKVFGESDFILFYNIETDKIIEKLKVGKGENNHEMTLLNKDNLIISGNGTIILIDIKDRKIINEFKFDDYLYFDDLLLLNEKIFYIMYILKKETQLFCINMNSKI